MDSSQRIGIVDLESQQMEIQVNAGLRWSERHKRPVTMVMLEPVKPLDSGTLRMVRGGLEKLLNTTYGRHPRYPTDTIVMDERKTLVVLKCDLNTACDIMSEYLETLKPYDVILAGYPQMHEPHKEAPKPEPEGIFARMKGYFSSFTASKPKNQRTEITHVPVLSIFYRSFMDGFERNKAKLKELYCTPASTEKDYAQPAAQPALSPAA